MVEDYEVDLHLFTTKQLFLKSDTKHKNLNLFRRFCERRSQICEIFDCERSRNPPL